MITHYCFNDVENFDYIYNMVTRTLSDDELKIEFSCLNSGVSYKLKLKLSDLSDAEKANLDKIGKMYVSFLNDDEKIEVSKLNRREHRSYQFSLHVSLFDRQLADIEVAKNANDQETAQAEEELSDKHDNAAEIYKEIEFTIAAYGRTHPLTGSPKQIAWANQIRESAFIGVVFDDPDNAQMRIQRTLDNPERMHAKFWIDNRKSFGY